VVTGKTSSAVDCRGSHGRWLYCSTVFMSGRLGWIASTTREVETGNPCRMGETAQLKTGRVGK
jgi:hypothetical protein